MAIATTRTQQRTGGVTAPFLLWSLCCRLSPQQKYSRTSEIAISTTAVALCAVLNARVQDKKEGHEHLQNQLKPINITEVLVHSMRIYCYYYLCASSVERN